MKISNTVALVTGANRGIGLAFTRELLARGARKVYGGARDPASIKHPGVQAIRLAPEWRFEMVPVIWANGPRTLLAQAIARDAHASV